MKVNNAEYGRIALEPLETALRNTDRRDILELHEIHRVGYKIEDFLNRVVISDSEIDNVVLNPGVSGIFGTRHLLEFLSDIGYAGAL